MHCAHELELHSPTRRLSAVLNAAATAALAATVLASAACAHQGLDSDPIDCGAAVGTWLDPATAKTIETDELLAGLVQRPVVLLGESHDNAEHHRWQLHTLAALHGHKPDMIIGFESFPRRVQPILDQWVNGELDPIAFLEAADWANVWGFDPTLYLPLFDFARQNRVPMVALNVDRDFVSRVRREGWAAISADERLGLSDPAPATPAYRESLARVFAIEQLHTAKGPELGDPHQAETEGETSAGERNTPAGESGGPADEGDASAIEGEAPVDEADVSADEADATAHRVDAPAHETDAPADEADAPAHETDAPAQEADAPADEADAPAHETDTPTTEGDAPEVELDIDAILESEDFAQFVGAQLTWDRAMAEALAAARQQQPGSLVVGILGRGHLEYGYGVPHQLADLGISEAAVLLPIERAATCEELPADLADAVFVIEPTASIVTARPKARLGVMLKMTDDGVQIAGVMEGSVAEAIALQSDDIVVAAAGFPIAQLAELVEIVQRQAPGTWLPLTIRRGGEEIEFVAKFPTAFEPPE